MKSISIGRRAIMAAMGGWWMWLGVGKAAPAAARPTQARAVQELCVECLAKRAKQRTAFISKWV
ncbi:hypothetical protein ASF61_22295 [Duganella sp. Leaf126]|nr:hypothetical protein ASF61_22295 [Duganella sp. Leaf126]